MSLNSPSTRRSASRLAVAALAAAALLVPATAAHAGGGDNARTGSGGGGLSASAMPYDFSDAFYRSNGVDPAALEGRRNGADGVSVVERAPDANHTGVRSRLTLPAYDTSGKEFFFTVMADVGGNGFTHDAAGRAAKALAEASPVYVFPTKDGDPLGVGNNRQADMIDLSHGYFSNNPLGIWVHVFVTWTPAAFTTTAGQKALADLARKNGLSLDGTPIIKSQSDIDKLTQQGYVLQSKRPEGAAGRYFICPTFKDPRNGAIAKDAFLATVRRADGTPLPAEKFFVDDFTALQATGNYPKR